MTLSRGVRITKGRHYHCLFYSQKVLYVVLKIKQLGDIIPSVLSSLRDEFSSSLNSKLSTMKIQMRKGDTRALHSCVSTKGLTWLFLVYSHGGRMNDSTWATFPSSGGALCQVHCSRGWKYR